MPRFLIRLVVSVAALWLTSLLADSLPFLGNDPIVVDSVWGALLAVLLLGLVNASIGSILRLITLPLNCMTLGLIGFLINVICFWIVSGLVPGFEVRGFWAAAFGSVVMGVLNGLLHSLVGRKG